MKSKEKIIRAAITVFAAKGKHGATMDEIAANAGLNKAMVYYYFSNKDNLFRQALVYIFTQIFKQVLGRLSQKRRKDGDPVTELEQLLRRHFRFIANHPIWARLIFYSLINEENDLKWAVETLQTTSPQFSLLPVLSLIERGISQDRFRPVDPKQTAVSLAGANLIYFLGRPVAKILLNLKDEEEETFMKKREESVVDLIFRGLLEEKEQNSRKIKSKGKRK
ncbi:MAG: TetR/AcrR family transcriptional regulator [Candidatus Aminicenantes bacterium]|nr:TetR/AcrR family transcriptional regulator [Candidatus Aminicenantes bacterium]